jgi:hypothetical protein
MSAIQVRSKWGGQSIRWGLATAFAVRSTCKSRRLLGANEIRYKFEQRLRIHLNVVIRRIHDSFCWMSLQRDYRCMTEDEPNGKRQEAPTWLPGGIGTASKGTPG